MDINKNVTYINAWAEKRTDKKHTQYNFKNTLKLFCKALNIKDLKNYITEKREHSEDIRTFLKYLSQDHYNKKTKRKQPYSPKSKGVYVSCLKTFLERELIKLDSFTEKDLLLLQYAFKDIKAGNGLKNPQAITLKRTPTNEELKYILSFANLKLKTYAMVMATSGLRPDEVLHLKTSEIKDRFIRVNWVSTKGGYARDTFITSEAKDQLNTWMRERQSFLQNNYRKSKFVRDQLQKQGYTLKKVKSGNGTKWEVYKDGGKLNIEELIGMDERIFPFGFDNVQKGWSRVLEKAGEPYNEKDNSTDTYVYSIYCLRRFYEDRLENSGINSHYFNYMMGHESELNRSYRGKFKINDLQEEYDKHSESLLIYERQPDLSGVHEQLKEKDKQISNMQQEIHNLRSQVGDFQKLVEDPQNARKLLKALLQMATDEQIEQIKEE